MMAAAALTISQFISQITFDSSSWYLALICFGVSLDRLYTYRSFKKHSLFGSEWWIAFGSHFVVIVLLIKVIVGLSHGLSTFIAEIPLWRRGFVDYFLNPEFLFAMIVGVLTWLVSGLFAEILDEMGLDQALIRQEMMAQVQSEKPPARERLQSLVFGLGSILVVITALIRVDIRAFFESPENIVIRDISPLEGGGWSTLLYFMLGLALLSQTQFISLNTRWSLQGVPVQRKLAGRWALYSLVFLLVITLVVSILPTSYSLGLLSTLNIVIQFFVQILSFIVQLIFAGIMFLVSLPYLISGRQPPAPVESSGAPTIPEPVFDLPSEAVSEFPWIELVKSVLFWSIFLGIIIFALVHYLRQHREILEQLRKIPGWKLLEQFWGWLRSFFGGVNQRVSDLIQTGRKRIQARRSSSPIAEIGAFLNVRRLNPRQRIYFFYLALIRRGGEHGLARREAQTPSEYASVLEDALPSVDDDVESITDAFIQARYTRQEIELDDANLVKKYWDRIRRALRRRRD
jgi:hypothetical protein